MRAGDLGPAYIPGANVVTAFAAGITSVGAGVAEMGMYEFDRMTNMAQETYEGTREGAQEVTQQVIGEGAKAYENTRQGAENITGKVIDALDGGAAVNKLATTLTEGITDAEKVKAKAYSDAEIAKANSQAKVAEAQAQAEIMKARVELAKLGIRN